MAKKIKEDIDYGDTPERMDPSLERKISNPESPFATTDIRLPYKKDGYTNPILQKKYEKQCLWDSIEDEIFY